MMHVEEYEARLDLKIEELIRQGSGRSDARGPVLTERLVAELDIWLEEPEQRDLPKPVNLTLRQVRRIEEWAEQASQARHPSAKPPATETMIVMPAAQASSSPHPPSDAPALAHILKALFETRAEMAAMRRTVTEMGSAVGGLMVEGRTGNGALQATISEVRSAMSVLAEETRAEIAGLRGMVRGTAALAADGRAEIGALATGFSQAGAALDALAGRTGAEIGALRATVGEVGLATGALVQRFDVAAEQIIELKGAIVLLSEGMPDFRGAVHQLNSDATQTTHQLIELHKKVSELSVEVSTWVCPFDTLEDAAEAPEAHQGAGRRPAAGARPAQPPPRPSRKK